MALINSIQSNFVINRIQNTNNRKQGVFCSTPQDTYSFSGFKQTDLDPENPLNRYKPDRVCQIKFDTVQDFWRTKYNKYDTHLSPWKLHIYSDNIQDYIKMFAAIGPYLAERDICWKTISNADVLNKLENIQKGKAFTIYPSSNQQMATIARDIDYIIRNNNMQLPGTNIVGDRQMGNSGRIFYRYQYKSGKMKDKFFDTKDPRQEAQIHFNYDSNRGYGQYLAFDMRPEDDIWYYFNPSDRPTIAAQRALKLPRFTLETCSQKDGKFELLKDVLYPIKGDEKLSLYDVEIDLSDPFVKSELNALPNGGTYSIGRDERCNFAIPATKTQVSRHHANIYRFNNQLYIQNMSINGTSVRRKQLDNINGIPIKDVESCPRRGMTFFLNKNTIYPLQNISAISLPKIAINMNNDSIKKMLMGLKDGQFIRIGRADDCQIRIDSQFTNVSRYHANIYKQNGNLYIQDISSYGTGLIKSDFSS